MKLLPVTTAAEDWPARETKQKQAGECSLELPCNKCRWEELRWRASDFGMSHLKYYVVTCKSCLEWKLNVVIKYFMVSATYVPSQDVLEQQTTETAALMELNNFSVRLSFIARKLLLLFFLRIETGPVWRATLSLCKYASELAGYGVNSVIARSIFLFMYNLQGSNHDETFVGRHMTT